MADRAVAPSSTHQPEVSAPLLSRSPRLLWRSLLSFLALTLATSAALVATPANADPVLAAVGDAYTVEEDTTLTVNAADGVLANDTVPVGVTATVMMVSGPSKGSVNDLLPDGSFRYTPSTDFHGTDTFTYRLTGGGTSSSPATVTITVNPVDDAPVAVDDAFSMNIGEVLVLSEGDLLANDYDVDGDPLSVGGVTYSPVGGRVSYDRYGGTFTITPGAFVGSLTLGYSLDNGSGEDVWATVTITVNWVERVPDATADIFWTDEDRTLRVGAPGVLGNDTDLNGDDLSAVVVAAPGHGQLTLDADGSFVYTPDADFNGTDSFTYWAHDGKAASSPTTVRITVAPVNDAPVAYDAAWTVQEDTAYTGSVPSATDVDGDTLTYVLVDDVEHGTLHFRKSGAEYVPDPDFHGTDSFTYAAEDGQGGRATATVTITVLPVKDAPVGVSDAYTVEEDATLRVSAPGLLGNDTDVDGDALTAVLGGDVEHGELELDADGSFTYVPDADFHGADSFTYRAFDGTSSSAPVTVTLTVRPVNDVPRAVADTYTVDEDETLRVSARGVLANDTDADGDALTAALLTKPAHGRLTLAADGAFTYVPEADFHGTDAFTYGASDGTTSSPPATVTITVTSVNDAPVGRPDTYRTDENTGLTVYDPHGVLANDTDVDGDSLTATLVDDVEHGSLVLGFNGTFRYVPERGFDGTDSFTYAVSDGTVTSAPVKVTLTVDPEATFASPSVKVGGAARVGTTVTATATSTPAADQVTYEWRVAGQVVGTGAAYAISPDDAEKQLTVAATFGKVGHESVTVTSQPVTVARATFDSTEVAIGGTVKAGETLTATALARPAADTVTIGWFVDGTQVGTGSTYEPKDADEGKVVRVEAVFTRASHVTATADAETGPVASRLAPTLTLDGATRARVGGQVELSWTTTRADAVRASGAWSGDLPSSGTLRVTPTATGLATYVVTATNANGTATAQHAVEVTHPAKKLKVSATTKLKKATRTASATRHVVVEVKGLAPREAFTVTVAGTKVRGTATATGTAKVVVPAPARKKARTYTVRVTGSVADRVGSTKVRVAPAAITVSLRHDAVRASDRQTVSVLGAAAREKVKVTYRGKVVASGRADRAGTFRFVLDPGRRWGTFSVRATATATKRTDTARLTVVRRCRDGVPRCD